jgi:hypothetical protein
LFTTYFERLFENSSEYRSDVLVGDALDNLCEERTSLVSRDAGRVNDLVGICGNGETDICCGSAVLFEEYFSHILFDSGSMDMELEHRFIVFSW